MNLRIPINNFMFLLFYFLYKLMRKPSIIFIQTTRYVKPNLGSIFVVLGCDFYCRKVIMLKS